MQMKNAMHHTHIRNDFIKRVQQDGKNESINFQPIKFQSETCNNNIGSVALKCKKFLHFEV